MPQFPFSYISVQQRLLRDDCSSTGEAEASDRNKLFVEHGQHLVFSNFFRRALWYRIPPEY